MASLIFVHGTGVRAAGYEQALGLVRKAMQGPDMNIQEALWGDTLGVRLHRNGATIPSDEQTMAVAGATSEDEIVALWSVLYEDPLYELRLISSQPAGARSSSPAFVPGRQTPAAAVQEAMLALTRSPMLSEQIRSALSAANLTDAVFVKAVEDVRQSSAYQTMLPFLHEPLSQIRSALARAIVARLVVDQAAVDTATPHGQSDLALPSLDGTVRDRLVTAIVKEMGAAELGVGTWLSAHLGGLQNAGALIMCCAIGAPFHTRSIQESETFCSIKCAEKPFEITSGSESKPSRHRCCSSPTALVA